jgi:hypothetical protein
MAKPGYFKRINNGILENDSHAIRGSRPF